MPLMTTRVRAESLRAIRSILTIRAVAALSRRSECKAKPGPAKKGGTGTSHNAAVTSSGLFRGKASYTEDESEPGT